MPRLLAVLSAALLCTPALAQDPLDLGVLRNDEIQVVQRRLYPKAGRTELGVQGGVIAFDPYTWAPKLQFTIAHHRSETMGWEAQAGAGYGLETRAYRQLDSPAYGKVPEAYRYLAGITGGLVWTPAYAKLDWRGTRVYHYDVFVPVVGGLTLEQAVDPNLGASFLKRLAFGPTAGAGAGARIFLPDGSALRVELRDDLVLQWRSASGTVALKQDVGVYAGFSWFGNRP